MMIVVSTTLQELESGCGQAVTATGSLLPKPTVIQMASHAYHYLTIFDKHTGRALHLGRTRRIASADQRIVLLANACFGCAPYAKCLVSRIESCRHSVQLTTFTTALRSTRLGHPRAPSHASLPAPWPAPSQTRPSTQRQSGRCVRPAGIGNTTPGR